MNILNSLRMASTEPADEPSFDKWVEAADVPRLVEEIAAADDFVVYSALRHVFMHAVLVPASLVEHTDLDDLLRWNIGVPSGWGITQTLSDPPSVWLSPPMNHTGSSILDRGEPLIFLRYFEARRERRGYVEFNQKIPQVFGLHYIHERDAFCRLDENGDLEDVISLSAKLTGGHMLDGTVVTIRRELLDQWMVLTNTAIVLMFDITRWRSTSIGSWANHEPEWTKSGDLGYRKAVVSRAYSYVRGVRVIRPRASREALVNRLAGAEETPKQYASFIAHDWKNKRVVEINCGPGHIANYFTDSDLPYETSPAFFRPEVLSKYKADTEKYQLTERSVSCRGTWSLQTYDINEAGQVHTYLIYLSHLPYSEQLYWKAYNEAPKDGISKRAFTSDFAGRWSEEYNALASLKQIVDDLSRQKAPWWRPRSEAMASRSQYPATTSSDEWATEILHLDQLTVEGFNAPVLRKHAEQLGQNADSKLGSLKLVEHCLIGHGLDEAVARGATAAFHELHFLRSRLKGHSSDDDAVAYKREALAKYGSYRAHFTDLCARVDHGLRTIQSALAAWR